MKNKSKSIYYLTYQDFPANTANSQQTVATCKYFVRNKFDVKLIFPLRSQFSDANLNSLKKKYEFTKEDFDVVGIIHKTKFEGTNKFKKIRYLYSHILWAHHSVRKIIKEYENPLIFYTRSDWVFFFLSRKNKPVVLECHKITKIRKKLIKYSIRKKCSKIIFLNKALNDLVNLKTKYVDKVLVQPAGYDEDFFYTSDNKVSKQVVYSGSLSRLGLNRDLDFIFNSFDDERLSDFNLKVYGGTENQISLLKNKYSHISNITFNIHLSKKNLGKELSKSEIGILASSNDNYSKYFTDPLKFYEYCASGLEIIATDFPAHKNLNKIKNITFFTHKNSESFINAVLNANKNKDVNEIKFLETYDSRIKNVIKFIS